MDFRRQSDWYVTAYSQHRHEELLNAAELERMIRQIPQVPQANWVDRIIARLRGLGDKEETGSADCADPCGA